MITQAALLLRAYPTTLATLKETKVRVHDHMSSSTPQGLSYYSGARSSYSKEIKVRVHDHMSSSTPQDLSYHSGARSSYSQ